MGGQRSSDHIAIGTSKTTLFADMKVSVSCRVMFGAKGGIPTVVIVVEGVNSYAADVSRLLKSG